MKTEGSESSASSAAAAGGGGDESPAILATGEAVEEEEDYEFEFSPVMDGAADSFTADELFQDGHIRTSYPLFDRSLLLLDSETSNKNETVEKLPFRKLTIQESKSESEPEPELEPEMLLFPRSESASSSSSNDSERMAKVQVQAPPFKSSSTGSSSRRWRLRDLMGGRSHSDGKEKFIFLAPNEKNKSKIDTAKLTAVNHKKEKGKGQKTTEVNMATLHRLFYDKPAGGGAGGGSRRSSEPYKQGFVGFLGLGRTF